MLPRMDRTHIADGFDPHVIERAAAMLASGEVVVFPTETVYGLGADAVNPVAVARVFELKKRPVMTMIGVSTNWTAM